MSKEPSWDLYRTFHAVLQKGSLSAAARALGLTQPSVARHIDALEAAVGADLFVRTPQGLSPTDMALELKPYAASLATVSAAFRRTASARAGTVSGTVRISASEVVGIEHLPPILAALRQEHPALSLELTLSNSVDDLLRREADIAVRMVRPEQQSLVAKWVGVIPLGLFAHKSYLARRGSPETLEALTEHDMIGYDTETSAMRELLARFPVLSRSEAALRADNQVAQLAAIRAGFGIGICQAPIGHACPDLIHLLADDFRVELETWVVMHENLRSSACYRAAFDALVHGLKRVVVSRDR